jgi:flagellar biosynthesis GTPase FlhF
MKNTSWILKFSSLALIALFLMFAPDAQAQKSRTKKESEPKEKKEREPKEKRSRTSSKDSGDSDELSRDEEKELKNEAKAFQKNPASFKKFKDDKSRAEADLATNSRELVRVRELEAQCANEVEELRKQIEDLEARLRAQAERPAGNNFGIPDKGLFYVVQIGAFQQKDVAVNNDNPDFRKENADGFNKYIMGVFNSIEQADQLRNFLLQLDFRKPDYRPFVAPYKDGTRISIDDALGAEEAARRRSKGQ